MDGLMDGSAAQTQGGRSIRIALSVLRRLAVVHGVLSIGFVLLYGAIIIVNFTLELGGNYLQIDPGEGAAKALFIAAEIDMVLLMVHVLYRLSRGAYRAASGLGPVIIERLPSSPLPEEVGRSFHVALRIVGVVTLVLAVNSAMILFWGDIHPALKMHRHLETG